MRVLRSVLLFAGVVACGSFGTTSAPPVDGTSDASAPSNEAGLEDSGTSAGPDSGACTPRAKFFDGFERANSQISEGYVEKKEVDGALVITPAGPITGSTLTLTLQPSKDGFAYLRRALSPSSCSLVVALKLHVTSFPAGPEGETTLVRVQFPNGQLELAMKGDGNLELVDDPDDTPFGPTPSEHHATTFAVPADTVTEIKLTIDTAQKKVAYELRRSGAERQATFSYPTQYEGATDVSLGGYHVETTSPFVYSLDEVVIE